MDLHKIFLKGHQRANMNSYIPQSGNADMLNPMLNFADRSSFFPFSKDCGNHLPHKSFSYPNCFNISPEKFSNRAMDFSKGIQHVEKLPAVSLTCIVGGFMEANHKGTWNPRVEKSNSFDNPIESMLNHLVTKSMEITRTMSCPETFIYNRFSPKKLSPKAESVQLNVNIPEKPQSDVKMSYAEVAKMNLSNVETNNPCHIRPIVTVSSSQKINTPSSKQKCKVISSPHQFRNNFVNNSVNNSYKQYGTNNSMKADRDCTKPKFHSLGKSSNVRRPQKNRQSGSVKRELGTKKNNQKVDVDGSMWSRDTCAREIFDEGITHSPSAPAFFLRVRSFSSDSDCSSEQSEYLKNPRVRSISECSVNSVDSDDSFIVFDDYSDDKMLDDSCDDESSSDDDECHVVVGCSVLPQAELLQCVNSKWNTLPSKKYVEQTSAGKSTCSFSPCSALKKVRFACGEALAKVRTLCVWDFAHRSARIGPWEQAARDRARFSSRISSLANVLNPILDPEHRSKIYNIRFDGS